MSIAEKLQAIAENEQKVYQAGYTKGQLEGDAAFVLGLNDNAFYGVEFPQDYDLVVNVRYIYSIGYAFYKTTGLKSIKFTGGDGAISCEWSSTFRETSAEVIDVSGLPTKPRSLDNTFYKATNLKRIVGALDCSMVTMYNSDCFSQCSMLEDVSFVPGTIVLGIKFSSCPLLSDASIESIINGLADLTGTTSQKVYFHSTVLNKLTTEQCQRMTDKNWTFA